MKISRILDTDVLVMGSGLAGVMAAIHGAKKGSRVCLASSGPVFSGSSFYSGTWGLGLVGPDGEGDKKDLIDTIHAIGMGVADRGLVDAFVSRIPYSIGRLKELGVVLREPEKKGEKEFIPCFDHKNRSWHGIEKEPAKKALALRLKEFGVVCIPGMELVECVARDGEVTGAIGMGKKGEPVWISCKAMVIASGGLGGLFKYRLNTFDITGMGHHMALKAGASLVNIEFMQMMPGYIKPAPKTIFNEKVFRYSLFYQGDTNRELLEHMGREKRRKRLEQRSAYGPFTSRLPSREVDFAIFREFLKSPSGVLTKYSSDLEENQPEFVKVYFEWLKKEKGLTLQDPIYLGIFNHASNGGIRIDARGWTGVPGLFACGEATGGMHGADRLGGLSTANGLVFGILAGEAAAEYSKTIHRRPERDIEAPMAQVPEAAQCLEEIRELNFQTAMVFRQEKTTLEAMEKLEQIKERTLAGETEGNCEGEGFSKSYQLKAALALSFCLHSAIRNRRESRGSHYRTDFPPEKEKNR